MLFLSLYDVLNLQLEPRRGKIGVSIHDQDLTVHFNFDSSTKSTFTNKAVDITNGKFHRVCISWNSVGGVVDLYYDDGKCRWSPSAVFLISLCLSFLVFLSLLLYLNIISEDIIDDKLFKTWSVSSQSLPQGDEPVKLTVGGIENENPNSFHGFIKDMVGLLRLQ